jgi:hypothetical protein
MQRVQELPLLQALRKRRWDVRCLQMMTCSKFLRDFGHGSVVNSKGQTIWIVDAHRDGRRFIVRADDKLTAFVELGHQVLTMEEYALHKGKLKHR